MTKTPLLSVVVPCYNEGSNVPVMYKKLTHVLSELHKLKGINYEIVYVNDGSADDTLARLHEVAQKDNHIRVIGLSRNFGKEIATTTGIHYAKGDAIVMIDADGQHPPEVIPAFVEKWQEGAQVVVGLWKGFKRKGLIKRVGSKVFYAMFSKFTGTKLIPGTTDFRLIDKVVQIEFTKMTERNRITRGLIDWLGFKHAYVDFEVKDRISGEATYSLQKLIGLALNSFVSLSLTPLYFSIYAGLVILPLTFLLGLASALEMFIGDPLGLNITGSAFLVIIVLFFVGVLLISQGIIALYLSHIHTETQNRPLFVIDHKNSHGIELEEIA